MPFKFEIKLDPRVFIKKIQAVGTKVIPYIKVDVEDLAEWAFEEIKARTPETSSGHRDIGKLWQMTTNRTAAREEYVIKNLYPDQDILIIILEEGAERHVIKPRKSDGFLHFFIGGKEIFTRQVFHPGIPALNLLSSVEAELRSKVDWLTQRFFDHVKRLESMGIT